MAGVRSQRSVPELFGDIVTQLGELVRWETRLARTEIANNVARLARGIALAVAGAVLLIPALVILLQAAVSALTDRYQLAPYWSALIVGGVVLLLGVILLLVGMSRLKAETIMPDRTVHQLRRDATVAREQMRLSNDVDRAA